MAEMGMIYLPHITTAHKPPPAPEPLPALTCGRNPQADEAAHIIMAAIWQERTHLACDPRLIAAADWKANLLADADWYQHDIPGTGETPNETVKRFGFPLGLSSGNSVESINRGGNGTAAQIIESWYASPHHHDHLTGKGWFQTQDRIGVGYSNRRGTKWEHWWVLLTAKEG